MIDAFIWFIAVELLGLIALPATFLLFKKLPDRGYAFGKVLSILFVSYLLWLAASAHILPNARWSIILIVALLAAASLLLAWRRRHELAAFISQNRRVIIATEVIFLLAFVLWCVMRAYNPDILFGEKPMDFAFLNGILRSDYFPANDPWLSGFSISYYYFGYLMMATLTKLTGVASSISFNLSLALIFALTAIGAFSIVYNLVRMSRGGFKAALGFGLVGVGLVLLLANLEGVLELFHAHGVGSSGFWDWVGIGGLDSPYQSQHWYPTDHWWWWRSTRVIGATVNGATLDYTITEFPFFSFLFADLHPHLMALPFVLLNLALCLEVVSSSLSPTISWVKANWPRLLVFALCLGSLGFLNTWDLPTYAFLFALAALIGAYLGRGRLSLRLIRDVGLFMLMLLGLALLLYIPHYIWLQPQVKGIAPLGDVDSRYFHFIILWGLLLFVAVSFVIYHAWGVLKKRLPSKREVSWAVVLPLVPFIIWALIELVSGLGFISVLRKLGHILPWVAILSLALLAIVRRAQAWAREEGRAPLFVLALMLTGFLLTMGCELFYVNDLFGPGFERMNTVFKVYYQAWVLFAIGGAFALYYIGRRWSAQTIRRRLARASWWGACALLLACSLIYPVAATITMTDGFGRQPTLDGLAFVERTNPSESEAVKWLNASVGGAPVIVEAFGGWEAGGFTTYYRISARTGLPTILGCPFHELQWRGSDRDFWGRDWDIDLIYESEDLGRVEELLDKYDVTYVYVGEVERDRYGVDVGERFGSFMDVAFENKGVTIYEVRGER